MFQTIVTPPQLYIIAYVKLTASNKGKPSNLWL